MKLQAARMLILGALVLFGSGEAQAPGALPSDAPWPTYGATYENTRHADLDRINAANVQGLRQVWSVHLGPHESVESTPVVVDGTMYVTTGIDNAVLALDAVTGRKKWRFVPQRGFMSPCCGALNRGVAVLNGRVFFATLDAQLIALEARTGKVVWHTAAGDPKNGFSETMAPLAWNNSVFIGSSGGDFGIRGSLSAYDAGSGKRLWRWYSVSANWEGLYTAAVNGQSLHRDIAREKRDAPRFRDAWMHGGGAIWMTPALDKFTSTLYLATANPVPVFSGSQRPGDNLYTDSIVALDANSGKMRWYYQETPHDVWEYEPSSPPVLVRARDAKGRDVDAVVQAGKTRWLYVLDRSTGGLMRISQSWTRNTGVYNPPPLKESQIEQLPLRGSLGPVAYDARRRLTYITQIERTRGGSSWWESVAAVNVDSGQVAWKTKIGTVHEGRRGDGLLAGPLSTAGLVFATAPGGTLYVLASDTGDIVHEYRLGQDGALDADAGPLKRLMHRLRDFVLPLKRALFHQAPPGERSAETASNPIAYQVAGREYIGVAYDSQPDLATGGAVVSVFALAH